MNQPAPCRAAGCGALCLRSTRSPYCPKHRRALSRYGHSQQTAVTIHELTPQLDAVQGWRHRNPTSPTWVILGENWGAVVEHGQAVNAKRWAGLPFIRHEAAAADLLRTVADAGVPHKAIDTALALHLLRDQQPARFKDDRAFRFVLTRRVRLLAETSQGTYWNNRTQRVTRVYRDVNPRAVDVMGQWLVQAFGMAGQQLAELDRRRGLQGAVGRQQLADALGAMQ